MRRFVIGSALLCVGVCAGVLLGSILDGPRVLVRRWTEEVRTLDLAAVPAQPGVRLAEFEALQGDAPQVSAAPATLPPSARAPVASAPSAVPAPSEEPKAVKAAVAAAPADVPAQDAKSLIAAMKQRQAGQSTERPAARRTAGEVVQVAAYKDAKSADVLVSKLRKSGFDSYVSRSSPGGPDKFRVRVRPKSGGAVDKLASTLELRGYRIWVTRE